MNPKNDHRTKNIYNSYIISEKLFYLSLIHKGLSQHEIDGNIMYLLELKDLGLKKKKN